MAHIFDATPPNQGPEGAGFAESEMRGGLNCHVELLPLRVKYGVCSVGRKILQEIAFRIFSREKPIQEELTGNRSSSKSRAE